MARVPTEQGAVMTENATATYIYTPKSGTIGLMGHLVADYPSPQAAREIIAVMVEAGVDLIEIQIPFSEPVALVRRALAAVT